ncbi:MAG: prephenate dehydratase domain-containing protein [Candidatus Peribacteraceae bacterium]|nr:prephenate dehydratase domain-containing protein [Candidatus Peribacteraceae bacterium]MDD5074451.1 prephenate dehydratase domain-containing protein [Candidatus Peribacteraceae bacterium]
MSATERPHQHVLELPSDLGIHTLQQYSFSDEAARMISRDVSNPSIHYHDRIEGVWDAVSSGEYGIIPIENSSGGVVWPHLDRLRSDTVRILAEANVKVRMCAGGLPGATLDQVRDVYSHQKGLDQCRNFLRTRLQKGLEEHPVSNTAAAAELVKAKGDPRAIALASRLALNELGLEELAGEVADLPSAQNITQFLLIHANPENHLPFPEALCHAAIITPENERGVLRRILSIIENSRVDLTSLHSRSIDRKQYSFYAEMRREGSPQEFDLMAQQFAATPFIKDVKWLGSWNKSYEN